MKLRLAPIALLVLCLGACQQTPPPVASPVQAAPATPVTTPDTAAITAAASDAATRAAREQTLRVQQHLRERQRQEQQARNAVQRGTGDERCIDGQKMRRVANGWVQAGDC